MHSALCPMASGWQVFVRFAMAGAAPCVSRGLSGVGRRESARFSTTGGFSFVRERMADLHAFILPLAPNDWRICMRSSVLPF